MRSILFLFILSLTLIWNGVAQASEPIVLTVGGTGSGSGFMRLLGDSYCSLHPEVIVKVLPSLGTAGGIRAVKNGAIDLAVASRVLQGEEREGLREYFLGESPFVFATHPAAKIKDVTLTEVVNIYNGTIATWPDGMNIRRILRPATDSDWLLMQDLSTELAKALEIAQQTEGLFLAITDTDTISYLERIRGSFGPSTLTMILAERRDVKILSFNGIQPHAAGPGKKEYPLTKQYYILTKIDTSATVDDFITFILSEQGLQLLSHVGIMPTN